MSKRRKKIDAHPDQLRLDFESRIRIYEETRNEILDACRSTSREIQIESDAEACIEFAASVKRAIRESGLSREQVVDGINEFFGWPTADQVAGLKKSSRNKTKHLSIHMFNHYLSKPVEYPMPSFYIYAIQHVTGSLEPTRSFAEPMGAKTISGEEVRQMALGKLDQTISEMQKLKRQLKGSRRG